MMKNPEKVKNGYLYYPGCSLKSTGKAYEESLLTTFRLLEIPFTEIKDWNCCGATNYMNIDEQAAFSLAARNLSIASDNDPRDLVAPCSACYLVLRKAQIYAEKYREVKEEIKNFLMCAQLGPIRRAPVRHPLEVFYSDIGPEYIRTRVKRQWKGGPVASYYGCLTTRPFYEVDKKFTPTRMDEILEALGIAPVEYFLKTKCCGGSLTGTITKVGIKLNYIILKEALRKGAQAIVTLCPLCQFNLDCFQSNIRKETGMPIDIPVLYLPQILGWALGGTPEELGLRRSISGAKQIKQWFSSEQKEAETYV
jgi:heterodisulfide reductase subunit B2